MKKLLFLLMIAFSVSSIALAQDDRKDKAKKTSTVPQKVHNTFSKDKKYNGHKGKHKANGHTRKYRHTAKKTTSKSD
jgi:hypothetical protein